MPEKDREGYPFKNLVMLSNSEGLEPYIGYDPKSSSRKKKTTGNCSHYIHLYVFKSRSHPGNFGKTSSQRSGFFQRNQHSPDINRHHSTDHSFHLIKIIHSNTPAKTIHWAQLEHPHHPSPLNRELYENFADNYAKSGNPQEGIHMLQSLIQRE